MKAAIYCRVSTEGQTAVNQEMRLKEWARVQGYDIDVFTEVASGASQARTELDRMMAGVRAGAYGCVAVWKLDRLGRSLQHLLQLIEEFRNKDIQFVSLTENIDTQSANGRLMLHIFGALAEFERELIRERTNAGLTRAKKQGKRLGRPPGSKDRVKRRRSGYWLRWKKDNK